MRRLVILLFLCVPVLALSPVPFGSPPVGRWKDGLVGAWPMDEGAGGVAHDMSGRSNHGTLNNVTWSHGDLVFEGAGSSDYVSLDSQIPVGTFTACCSVHAGDVSSFVFAGIFGESGSSNDTIRVSNTGRLALGTAWLTVDGAIQDETDYFIVVTRDSSNAIKCYIDGQNVTSGTPSYTGLTFFQYIGVTPTDISNRSWLGTISQIILYDRALTPSEIRQLYIDPDAWRRPDPTILPQMASAAGGEPSVAPTPYYYLSRVMPATPVAVIALCSIFFRRPKRCAA